jgi:hypothetical protein
MTALKNFLAVLPRSPYRKKTHRKRGRTYHHHHYHHHHIRFPKFYFLSLLPTKTYKTHQICHLLFKKHHKHHMPAPAVTQQAIENAVAETIHNVLYLVLKTGNLALQPVALPATLQRAPSEEQPTIPPVHRHA